MKAHFAMFAAYNAWANRRLFAAAAALAEAELRADLGAAFGSLHGTLNHLLVADVIWLARFRGARPPDWPLDHLAHDAFADLRAAREALDEDLERFVSGLEDEAFAAPFRYVTVGDRRERTQPLGPALAHLFNHQTHHRGQCHALLTRLTGAAPPLDLVFFQREAA